MFTRPSADDILEGCIVAIQNDLLPNLMSERAQVSAVMMQALLQSVRQRLPTEQQILANEHNQMVELFGKVAQSVQGDEPAAQRLRERAKAKGACEQVPVPMSPDELSDRYRDLSQGLVETMDDLDELLRNGDERAEPILASVRSYLAQRTATDFATLVVGAGMAGRG